jgi:deoxyribodipyrimidine photolyase-like uncharacterized protein
MSDRIVNPPPDGGEWNFDEQASGGMADDRDLPIAQELALEDAERDARLAAAEAADPEPNTR